MEWTKPQIKEMAEYLQGTTKSIDDAIESVFGDKTHFDDFPIEALQYLDSIVLLCASCGWWMEAHEVILAKNGCDYVCVDNCQS